VAIQTASSILIHFN